MKYQVITRCGGYFWPGWSAVIGEYRWLWVAKCRAWWHVRIENPHREVTVISKSNAPAQAAPGGNHKMNEPDNNKTEMSELTEYQKWVKDTAKYPKGLTYPTNQLASEAGEVLGGVNKGMRASHCLDVQWDTMSPALQSYIRDEAGDVLWSLTALCNEIGCTIADLAEWNREKLEARTLDGTLYRAL